MNYFGTDGIRGEVKKKLDPNFLTKLASSSSRVFKENKIEKICIGKDPRISSDFILDVLVGTLNAYGVTVVDLGVVSTPVISYTIINNDDIDAGIMISASHNSYVDNGIKFFGANGKKISEEMELAIESEIDSINTGEISIDNIGKRIVGNDYVNDYIDFITSLSNPLGDLTIAIDCANGSASFIAPTIFKKLGANVKVIANEPDGYNINNKVGSTHVESIQKYVKENRVDFAFSYDGDADRIIMIDKDGNELDGDYILYILAKYLKSNDDLNNNGLVSTVMTNIGFKKAIKEIGVENYETAVGDKYVMRELDNQNLNLGGEQSGHIILSNLLPTGDGILVSVFLAHLINEDKDALVNAKMEMRKYPQKLVNHKCEDKNAILENVELLDYIKEIDNNLGEDGRILVRASGTEELVRVMVESNDMDTCEKIIEDILEIIKKI